MKASAITSEEDPAGSGIQTETPLAGEDNPAPVYYLNEYQVDLAHGGPEEGGWTYETGVFKR